VLVLHCTVGGLLERLRRIPGLTQRRRPKAVKASPSLRTKIIHIAYNFFQYCWHDHCVMDAAFFSTSLTPAYE
jgi:hypothetical protein